MTNPITRTTLEALHVGGPTLRLRYAGLTWLTDPTFDAPRDYPGLVTLHKLAGPAVSPEQVGPVDVVLLSHDEHADNLDISGREFVATVPIVLSTPGAAERMNGVRGLRDWETYTVREVEVTSVPALHGPEGCEPFSGIVTGFVLRAAGEPTVYVSGDNASVDVVREIVERVGHIDVAVLNVGAANVGRFGDADATLNARTALQAAEILGEAVIVAVHGEGWAHFSETLDHLGRTFEYAGRRDQLVIPPLGESVGV
ncbi:MBL fold metallo-hydrolase [Nocardia cyriacigeorgica]|uniref:MBL fold metallo-hydrolase n=1 Tax=Nocardia cyriacigeorgica TaxID=135487 RepID=A0A6P1CZS4_9NOCA|nr:MBL fold metallo-hydrolase [Nocardia cyriacigeorgica]NEW40099.1 MBL fold metallo-hydrolase [Nocardia cyriacigeorgica]NEW43358.1 MBL fold metallo-hydrolase [Nocardia cyriacigeorgica]NEW51575.1 MBL fold metallo-hydrolase [Nocardia cyriacigeorgica]NEW56622.1 MBL fold metallo-hydrolase [Nocardia cyriacigeorgica]